MKNTDGRVGLQQPSVRLTVYELMLTVMKTILEPVSPGPHDGTLPDVLRPDPCAPVTNSQEVLKETS